MFYARNAPARFIIISAKRLACGALLLVKFFLADKLQRSIAALTKGKTLLVIAHRLSTIKNADNIVVLKNGAIEAAGTQEELLASCPLYKDMWLAHIGAQNWAVSAAEKEA